MNRFYHQPKNANPSYDHEPYHPASLYWDSLHRKELVTFFNDMFGTDIA
jgi:hypothetical protein